MESTTRQPSKEVYCITERDNMKPLWTRIGVGFVNRDDSINLLLDLLPVSGRLQIRNAQPRTHQPHKETTHDQ
ncbi:MAG: hypothetical protein HY696_13040 [Deltaproteobacteria bacterium]|nr:hypothetical protein [Deltaproteobacteria bacterium]